MGQVVMFFDDKYEIKLRRIARKKFGKRKGAMAATVKCGLDLLETEMKRESDRADAYCRLLEMVKNAKSLGIGKFSRAELYDRNLD